MYVLCVYWLNYHTQSKVERFNDPENIGYNLEDVMMITEWDKEYSITES